MSDPLEIVKGFYAALSRGDVASLLATLGDDLEWTEAERFPYYSGTLAFATGSSGQATRASFAGLGTILSYAA